MSVSVRSVRTLLRNNVPQRRNYDRLRHKPVRNTDYALFLS